MLRLVDTHNHIQMDAFDADRAAVMERALERLHWMLLAGDTVESSRAGAALAATVPGIYAAAGIHPHNAAGADAQQLAEIAALTTETKVVAIGEIGLDYHYLFSPKDDQRLAFARQLDMAASLQLPVIIHCREAEHDFIEIAKPYASHFDTHGGVMHCFGGNAAFARTCLEMGLYISFAGNVTFPKATDLREAAACVPLHRLLVETDAPYLAPKPLRGRRCEPALVVHTAEFLAEFLNVPLEKLAAATTANACNLFRITPPNPDPPHCTR